MWKIRKRIKTYTISDILMKNGESYEDDTNVTKRIGRQCVIADLQIGYSMVLLYTQEEKAKNGGIGIQTSLVEEIVKFPMGLMSIKTENSIYCLQEV
jgi:hypothetical protein